VTVRMALRFAFWRSVFLAWKRSHLPLPASIRAAIEFGYDDSESVLLAKGIALHARMEPTRGPRLIRSGAITASQTWGSGVTIANNYIYEPPEDQSDA
jgi:hypothetical protein